MPKSKKLLIRATETDLGKTGSHGQIPIPREMEDELKEFFGYSRNRNGIKALDLEDGDKWIELSYNNYRANGKSPNDRISSINKYSSKKSLCGGDQIFIERINKQNTSPFYYIGYEKKDNEIFLQGVGKGKAKILNTEKYKKIIAEEIKKSRVVRVNNNEVVFNVSFNRKKSELKIKKNGSFYNIFIDGKPLKLSNTNSYLLTFTKRSIKLQKEDKIKVIDGSGKSYYKHKSNQYVKRSAGRRRASSLVGPVTAFNRARKKQNNNTKTRVTKGQEKRSVEISNNALRRAGNLCEINPKHKSFNRRGTNIKYMEPHHIIPTSVQDEFINSLDSEPNIISLCSECHNKIHYGDGEDLVKQIFTERYDELDEYELLDMENGEKLTLELLLAMLGY